MKKTLLVFVIAIVSLTYSCKKDDKSEFSNKLTLGTGLDKSNAFNLSGEGTTFTKVGGSALIYFRLESAEDMAGDPVILDFESTGGSLINTISREQAQDYGHIMVSSFNWEWMTGNYVVKAYLLQTSGKKLITSKNFTIN